MPRRFHMLLVGGVLLLSASGVLRAQSAEAEARVALVIGNSAYQSVPSLRNPVNDARAMDEALSALRFRVIRLENATKAQMATVWPSKTSAQLYAMLGVTPMIGRNDTGPIFSIADGQKLVAWANSNHIGLLAFWSVGRDNGGCPGGGVSPTCSSISQSTYQFTSIFAGFTG